MSRRVKVISLIILVFLGAGSLFADGTQPKAAWPAYALSILLGFGTGQYYLGDNGTGFLIGDVVGLGGIIVGGAVELASASSVLTSGSYTSSLAGVGTGLAIVVVGSIVYVVSRVWEVIDVLGAADRAQKAGTVAQILPTFDIQQVSYEPGAAPQTTYALGLTLKY